MGVVQGGSHVQRAERRFLAQAVAAQQGCGFYWTWWGGVWGKLERHLVCCALLMDVLNRFHVDLFGWWLQGDAPETCERWIAANLELQIQLYGNVSKYLTCQKSPWKQGWTGKVFFHGAGGGGARPNSTGRGGEGKGSKSVGKGTYCVYKIISQQNILNTTFIIMIFIMIIIQIVTMVIIIVQCCHIVSLWLRECHLHFTAQLPRGFDHFGGVGLQGCFAGRGRGGERLFAVGRGVHPCLEVSADQKRRKIILLIRKFCEK